MCTSYGTLQNIIQEAAVDLQVPVPYMQEFYNLHPYHQLAPNSLMARVLNSLQEGLNTSKSHRLPRSILIMLDRNLLDDLPDIGSVEESLAILRKVINWFVKQINLIVR